MCEKTLSQAMHELEYSTSALIAIADGTLQLLEDCSEHFVNEKRYYAFHALVKRMQLDATDAADIAENVASILYRHRWETHGW